jgi:hypothetical protein
MNGCFPIRMLNLSMCCLLFSLVKVDHAIKTYLGNSKNMNGLEWNLRAHYQTK